MEELIATIARGLVDDKEAVSVTADPADEEGNVVYHLHVGAEDMGRVIGKQGRKLKGIGKSARLEIEALLGTKVYLELWVKIKENWRDSDFALSNFGYKEM